MQPRGPAGPYSQINRRANRDRVRSGMREFESSHSSQPVPVAERLPPQRPERPTISGLLRSKGRSPRSRLSKLRVEVAESLRSPPRKLPFSGDWSRRLGSIITVLRSMQSHLDLFLPPPRGNWELLLVECRAGLVAQPFGRFAWRGVQRL
jgi:hypothetical protein